MKWCGDYELEPDFPGHCTSCHEDMDEYAYEPLSHFENDEEIAQGCCRVMSWLDSRLEGHKV